MARHINAPLFFYKSEMRMKKTINIFFLTLILLTGKIFAQQITVDFEAKLQKLERDIARLRTVAERYNRQKELGLLTIARNEYLAARKLYDEGKIQRAKFHYLKSQNIVVRVAQTLIFTPAAKMKSELKIKIERAERIVNQNPNNEEGRYLLSKTRFYQQRMDESLQRSAYQNAYKFYKIALYFANRILQLYNNGNLNITPTERYKMLADNIKKLYNEVNVNAYNNKNTASIMAKAVRLIARAKADHEKGAYRQAFANLQIAEKLLYRVIDLNADVNNLSEKKLRNNLFSLKRFIDSIEKKMNIHGDNRQLSLLSKARQYARSAEMDINNRAYADADKKISMGQKLAGKALQTQLTANTDNRDLFQKRLSEVTRLLRLQEKRINNINDPSIANMHNEAKNLLNNAERLAKSGNTPAAFFNVQIALKFIYGIKLRLDNNKNLSASKDKVQMQINEIERKLSKLYSPDNDEKIKLLKDLFKKAKSNYRLGKYEVSADLLRIINAQMQLLSH